MQAAFLLGFFGTFALIAPVLQAQTSATFGETIALGGIPSDIVLDESRQRLYLVNSTANRVDIFDYSGKLVIGSIPVGNRPLGAAMSVDSSYLYVANHNDSTMSVITLGGPVNSLGSVTATVSLPAPPQGLETEISGRVVICTDGTGTNNANNTLLVYDPTQTSTSQVQAVTVAPTAATPPTITAVTARPTVAINGRLMRTPDGSYIVGVNSVNNNASTQVYVYEPASTTVLLSRIVVGQSSTLSMAPDGRSFMAGFTRYDIATLNVLAQQNTANAPFTFSSTFATTFNVGGSAFAPDGSALYSAFNTAALTTPPPTPNGATLLISNPKNLGIQLGINLPEAIVGKMVITADGKDAWGTSLSGVTHLPLSTLYSYPILMPESTTVFLAQDDCHQGVVQGTLKINNLGGGKLTFAVPSTITNGSAAVEVTASTGVAPSTLTLTMDPGRSGVSRAQGTNLYSGGTGAAAATNTGAAVNIQLVSPNAINVPPLIRVFMNNRDSTTRGQVYPVNTVPASTTAASNQGLWDIVLDSARNLVYITNAGYNRIEVFDTVQKKFLAPIPVGQLPHQMAMGLDGNTLYVAETGGETIDIVDLTQMAVTSSITMPPFPRNATAATVFVDSMAVGLSALQFVASNGNLWEVINGQAAPRTGTFVTGVNSVTGAQTAIAAPQGMAGSLDGSSVLLLGGSGTGYLYDGLTDTYSTSRQFFSGTLTGYYGPLAVAPASNFMLANGLVVNSALTAIGGATTAGGTPITPPGQPSGTAGQSPLRNVAAVAPVDQNVFLRLTTPVRTSLTATTTDDVHSTLQLVDTRTGIASTVAEAPENPAFSVFNSTRTNMPPRQMVVDPNGTAYAITLSGLSVIPTSSTTAATLPALAPSRAVLNANTGAAAIAPGSFVTITGANLASNATASSLPPPTVLGGSCVLVDNVAIPLLSTSPTQIQAQLPAAMLSGSNVLQVRSLDRAQRSAPMIISVQPQGQ
jgi:DNA-binding beta-propeller fold protein YncE